MSSWTSLARGFLRRDPGQVERRLLRLAIAVDRHDERKSDGVLTRVVVRADARRREVLGDGERLERGGDPGERHRAEVLLQVPQQRVPDPLAVVDAAGDEGSGDDALQGGAQ